MKKTIGKYHFVIGLSLFLVSYLWAADTGDIAYGGYLFAHMTKQDYGRLYYSISSDGLHWELLNKGKRVLGEDYRGHPDICQGHDGKYYLIGNYERKPSISLWVSDNLVTWKRFGRFAPDIYKIPNFKPTLLYLGAPKIFFDASSSQYLITWHSTIEPPIKEDTEQFWRGMRTLYVTSKDLKTFSNPRRLFDFEMATIDVVIREEKNVYYAFIKDEKYPSFDWPTGKTIRICSSQNLLGPYTKPGPKITPNFREAPTLIPRLDGKGWYLYYEQYPAVSYGLSTAPHLAGPWYDVYCGDYEVPTNARHGCMIPLTNAQLDAIVKVYGNSHVQNSDSH
ncbi:MAG: glycoside hydrolase family 43 protein [Sedimentisphaerales bacterium]|nr:glycoside hydrolase family 43 protein [Sedimentisphaerales bacterium]